MSCKLSKRVFGKTCDFELQIGLSRPFSFFLHSGSSLHRPESPPASFSSSSAAAAANEAPGHRLRPIGGGAGEGAGGGRSAWSAFWKSRIIGAPYFSNETETRVLVSRGQTCYLHCLVGNLGDRQVRLTDFGII